MAAARRRKSPCVLVTGFEPFPGAPVNPTAWLVEKFREEPPDCGGLPFRAEVLPVDYRRIGPSLARIGADFAPDIAIHFGLARDCQGFRLERVARNKHRGAPLDNCGYAPADGPICEGATHFVSTLPLEAIHAALSARDLPVEWSDDAGGYLCNMAFALSAGGTCEGFRPEMSGFVHVPPIDPGHRLSEAQLVDGALAIVRVCLEAWRPG